MKRMLACTVALLFLGISTALAAPQAVSSEAFYERAEDYVTRHWALHEGVLTADLGNSSLQKPSICSFPSDPPESILNCVVFDNGYPLTIPETIDDMASILIAMLDDVDYIAESYDGAVIYDVEKANRYREGAGLAWIVGDTNTWLSSEHGVDLMMPMFFYSADNYEIIDGTVYLVILSTGGDESQLWVLADQPIVREYMQGVTLSPETNDIDVLLASWLQGPQPVGQLGTVEITIRGANVRAGDSQESERVAKVQQGDQFPLMEVMASGWYRILLPDGQEGFVSPKVGRVVAE